MKTLKGTTDIQFEYVDTAEKFLKLKEFAHTFEHDICPENVKAPVLIIKRVSGKGDDRKEEWIGFVQMVNCPLLFTAWNPNIATNRDVVEGMKAFTGWAKLQGVLQGRYPGFAAVPNESKTFTPETMEKMGFRRLFAEIYAVEE